MNKYIDFHLKIPMRPAHILIVTSFLLYLKLFKMYFVKPLLKNMAALFIYYKYKWLPRIYFVCSLGYIFQNMELFTSYIETFVE